MTNCAPKVTVTSHLPDYARNAHGDIACRIARWVVCVAPKTLEPAPQTFVALAARKGRSRCHRWRVGPDEDGAGPRLPRLPRHRQQDRWPGAA